MSKEYVDEGSESDSVEDSSQEDDQWDDWNEDDGDEEATKSLFDEKILTDPIAAIEHDAEVHGFDLRKFIVKARLDDYGVIRFVNYVRGEVAAGRNPLPVILSDSGEKPWVSDDFLKPVLGEDPLLFHDYTPFMTGEEFEDQRRTADGDTKDDIIHRLEQENAALREALESLRAAAMPEELRPSSEAEGAGASSAEPSSAAAAAAAPEAATSPEASAAMEARKIDRAYFDSYSSFNIHREMISDHPRTESYRQALEMNPDLIRGKRVLDVGCGTGILSLFACRGGAARVVSVDGSERMAAVARDLSRLNGFDDVMRVVSGKLEGLQALPLGDSDDAAQGGEDGKVDVLVSEWMGYALLFETMLDTVLAARDRFLRPGGAVLPDIASIYIAGASEAALDLAFWRRVYGFDFSPVAADIRLAGADKAQVAVVDPRHLVTAAACVKELDLCTMRSADQDFTAEFTLELATEEEARLAAAASPSPLSPQEGGNGNSNGNSSIGDNTNDANSSLTCGAVLLWFDTAFSARHCAQHPVVLSTSPHATPTHWAQTVLPLREPVSLRDFARLRGRVSLARSHSEHRCLDVALEYRAEPRLALPLGTQPPTHTQVFRMSVTAPA